MTIARRLILLLTVPVLILIGLGIFVGVQLNRIEVRNRFVTETQIGSLEALGKISRSFTELRVNVRSYLLVADKAEQTRARALFDAGQGGTDTPARQICRRLHLGRHGPKDVERLPGVEPRVHRRRGKDHVHGGCGAARSRHRRADRTAGRHRRAPRQGVRRVDPAQWLPFGRGRPGDHRSRRRRPAGPVDRRGRRRGRLRRLRPADVPQHRSPDPVAREDRQVRRRRRLRHGRAVHPGGRRNRGARPIDRRPQAGGGGDGGAALAESRHQHAVGRVAGRRRSRGVRSTAHFRPHADARRGCRELLSVRERAAADPADRQLRPGGRRRPCRHFPAWRGPRRRMRPRAQADCAHASAARLSADLIRPGQGRAGPGSRVAGGFPGHADGCPRDRIVSPVRRQGGGAARRTAADGRDEHGDPGAQPAHQGTARRGPRSRRTRWRSRGTR